VFAGTINGMLITTGAPVPSATPIISPFSVREISE
jgi:hypothetical protein